MGVRYRNGTGRDGAGWEGWGRLRRGSVRNPGCLLPQTPTFIAESVICCFEDAGGVIKRGGPLHPVDGPQPVHLFFRSHIVSHHLWEEVAGSGSQVQDTPLSPLPSSLKPPPPTQSLWTWAFLAAYLGHPYPMQTKPGPSVPPHTWNSPLWMSAMAHRLKSVSRSLLLSMLTIPVMPVG